MNELQKQYNLGERTAKFGESIIEFCETIKLDPISQPLIGQLVRSGTSIGANYAEANAASSKRDFRNKIFTSKKEAEETIHWLRMVLKYIPDRKNQVATLQKEVQELTLIFGKILSTLHKNSNSKLSHSTLNRNSSFDVRN